MFLLDTTFGDLEIGQHFYDKTYHNHFIKTDKFTAYNIIDETIIHPSLIWTIEPLDKTPNPWYNTNRK